MKLLRKISGLRILAAVLLIYIFLTAAINSPVLLNAYKLTTENGGGFSEFINNVKTGYTSQIKGKNDYINLNGLFAKYSGRKVYNGVATLKNGMLTNDKLKAVDTTLAINNISEFDKWLEDSGREFVYVQEPHKVDMKNELLPVGVDLHATDTANTMVSGLEENGIDVLDLREYVAKTPEDVEKYFYKTDHHWNNLGAFLAYQKIVEKVESLLPNEKVNSKYTNTENWKKTTYEDWFLGTHGKRVGVNFGGVDDYVLYEPKFDTEISTYITNHLAYYSGDFTEANVRKEYFDQPNYFEESPYCAYIGGDYHVVQHRNENAGNNIKALILKDSFQLPVQSFLSTAFAEVEVLDPRYYNSSSIAEYIEVYDPDVVMLMVNPSVMYHKVYYNYGIDYAKKLAKATEKSTIYKNVDLNIKPHESQYNYINTANNLTPGAKYTFSLKDVTLNGKSQPGITVAVFHPDGKRLHASVVVDPSKLKDGEGFEWSFVTPRVKGNLKLIIYPGIYGKAANSGATIDDITLIEYK